MNLGDTFYGAVPGNIPHLWVIITHPISTGEIAIVNFTTRRPPCDDSCIVTPGEHPFIDRETIVAYRRARLVDGTVLESARQHGYIATRTAVSPTLLRRVQDGALASIFTQQAIQAAVKATLGFE